jgi:anti-anti-sigma regulatory factor
MQGIRSVRDCGGQLKLSNVQPRVRQVLQITYLLKIFDIDEDEASAIQSFGAA